MVGFGLRQRCRRPGLPASLIDRRRSDGMLTDEEVVARVQTGQTEIFALIFDRHYARIERYVHGLGLPDADQEDLVAETFTRAFARNRCTDRIREKQRAPEMTFLEDAAAAMIPDDSDQASPLEALLQREQL